MYRYRKPTINANTYKMKISPQPKGERIKFVGDSLKKSFFNCGIIVSAFLISLESKDYISPIASEYLLSLSTLEMVMVYFPGSTCAL